MKLHELESLFITKLSEKYSLTKPVLKKVFHKFDRDGSGYLSVTELSQAIASFINGVDMTLIQELVRHYDVDQDGTINLDEFCHFLLSKDGTNPTTWLTTNTSNERPSSRSSSRSNQEPQNISTSTQRNLTKQQQQRQQEEEEASTQHRIEHQAKLFLQGMKSILMKNILENRESGKIPKRERLSQKTSQLILTQSKALLQKLFAPYETSSNSQGIPLNGFKRYFSS